MELLKTIVFVFCKFCMSIYAEVLFTATEVQFCQCLDVVNN